MQALANPVLTALIVATLMLLGSGSIAACIRLVAVQGILLGLLPLVQGEPLGVRLLLLAAGSMALKGVAFPWLLARAQREAGVRREVEPWIGFTASLVFGVAALAGSLWLTTRLPLPPGITPTLALPVALFLVMVGLFLIVTRRKALTQVLGYLVLENGVYVFGVGLALREHMLVELGVLLDAFVAVFVMGIIVFHISREFDHIDVDRLSALKDWEE